MPDLIVFGGSFDPPHRGHLRLLRAALRTVTNANAAVVPAFCSPQKAGPHASGRDRLALIEAALDAGLSPRHRARVSIHHFELKNRRPTFTYETLRHLARGRSGSSLWLLLGSDSANALPSWKRPDEIRARCRLLVGRRPGAPLPEDFFEQNAASQLPGSFPKLSSSKIRLRLLLDKPVKGFLAPPVFAGIAARGLYGIGIRSRLSRELKPRRFEHVVLVARHAAALAKRHGLDQEKAALAGLLHDCGRAVPVGEMAAYAREKGLKIPALEETTARDPILLHAHISEHRARHDFGIEDPEVLSAIRKHTLGDAEMSPLDRLVYAADASSPDRDYEGVGEIRSAARRGVDEGFAFAAKRKLSGIIESGAWLHPSMTAVWNASREAS